MRDFESGVHPPKVLEGGEQQRRSDQQHGRESHFSDDEAAERPLARRGRSARVLLQGVVHVGPRRVPRGHESEAHANANGSREREQEGDAVDVNLVRARQRGSGIAREEFGEPGCQDRAAGAARERQQHVLGQELPENAGAPGAERGTDRNLALPGGAACEQEVRDVGTRNQQDEAHRAEHHEHLRAGVADDLVFQRDQGDTREVNRRALQRQRNARQLGDRLLARDAGREPRIHGVRMNAVLQDRRREHHRHDEIHRALKGKTPRENSDDRRGSAFHADRAADDVGRAAETLLPEGVADEQHVASTRRLRLAAERASRDRLDSEEREEIGCDLQRRPSIGRLVDRHGQAWIVDQRGVARPQGSGAVVGE